MTNATIAPDPLPVNEEWRPVAGHEGSYEVSNMGRVRSVSRVRRNGRCASCVLRGKVLKPGTRIDGVRQHVNICREGKCVSTPVHRLVAEAFVPRPEGANHVNHINFDPGDNRAANLEWCTHLQNMQHSMKAARMQKKLTAAEAIEIHRRAAAGECQRVIAKDYGVSQRLVFNIKHGIIWGWVTKTGH